MPCGLNIFAHPSSSFSTLSSKEHTDFPDRAFLAEARKHQSNPTATRTHVPKTGFLKWDPKGKLHVSDAVGERGWWLDGRGSTEGKEEVAACSEQDRGDGCSRIGRVAGGDSTACFVVQQRTVVRRCALRSDKEEWLLCVAVGCADEGVKERWMAAHWRAVRVGPWVAFWGCDVDLGEAEGKSKSKGGSFEGKWVSGGEGEKEPLLLPRGET